MDKKILIIIGVVLVIVVAFVALLFTGVIHNGSFAMSGTTFGPGTYVVGTDIPPGEYDLKEPFEIQGSATFKASSDGSLSISSTGVQLKKDAVVTIREGGNMIYKG